MYQKIKKFVSKYLPHLVPFFKYTLRIFRRPLAKRHIKKLLSSKKPIRLELGAGDKKGTNGWITIDLTKNCDILWDLREGLPFPDKSVHNIYSSHLFEHLSFRDGKKLLAECKRVLAPRGVFSICVPNARLYIEAYITGSIDTDNFFGYKSAFNNTTKIDYMNYVAYMDGHHKYMFDEENILFILQEAGFKKARLRKFDPELDLEARDFESIYAEALK